MAARRQFRFRRSARRHGNLVWITVVVKATLLENTATEVGLLVSPGDWDPTGVFDRATLMGIRGWLSHVITAAGTTTDASAAYSAINVKDVNATAVMNPGTAGNYDTYDTLYCTGVPATGLTAAASAQLVSQVNVKARRRITSQDNIVLSSFLDIDTATPRVNINGVIRSLVKTE